MVRVFAIFISAFIFIFLLCGRGVADSLITIDGTTGHILYAYDASRRLPVASLAKVATALVAIDMVEIKRLSMSQVVAVPQSVIQASGGARPGGLQAEDKLSIRDLIYCAMLASDDTAANTIAHYAGMNLPRSQGLAPIQVFVTHMNALARLLKMRDTLFLNATGEEPREGTIPYSTAADMARLTRYAYTRPGFRFFASQQNRVVHVQRNGQDFPIAISNTNKLLGHERIDGVKSASSAQAGGCLILSSEKTPQVVRDGNTTYVTPRRISVVVLGSKDRFGQGKALIQQGWKLYDQWAAEGRKMKTSSTL